MAAKPRRRRLAKFFGQRPDPRASTNMQLAPRRLEPRRMLDAAAGALALEMFDALSEFVQAFHRKFHSATPKDEELLQEPDFSALADLGGSYVSMT